MPSLSKRELEQLAARQRAELEAYRGERWWELVEHFDPAQVQRLPVKDGRAFIMGELAGLTVVEVSKDMVEENVTKLGQWLADSGVRALIVREGIRFLRVRPADDAVQKMLEGT